MKHLPSNLGLRELKSWIIKFAETGHVQKLARSLL